MKVNDILLINYRLSFFFYKKTIKIIAHIFKVLNIFLFSCHISPKAIIGRNLIISHPVGIVIGDGVIIGDNCLIAQNVTLGVKNFYKSEYPLIGNNVIIGANAVILGAISIGDNSVIGANSTILSDIPKDSVAVGSPAIIKKKNNV